MLKRTRRGWARKHQDKRRWRGSCGVCGHGNSGHLVPFAIPNNPPHPPHSLSTPSRPPNPTWPYPKPQSTLSSTASSGFCATRPFAATKLPAATNALLAARNRGRARSWDDPPRFLEATLLAADYRGFKGKKGPTFSSVGSLLRPTPK